MTRREIEPRIARWWLKIQDFDAQIEHRSGQRMAHVDALSRAAVEEPHDVEVAGMQVAKVTITSDDWIFSMQLQDPELQNIVRRLNEKSKDVEKDFVVSNGRLYRKVSERLLWVVPKNLRWKIVSNAHDKAGHLATNKTIERLQANFWFARMRNFVKGYINSCLECAYNKANGRQNAEYHYEDTEPIPFTTIHIDHLGPFPKSRRGNEYVVVIVDSFTKFVIIKAVKKTSTKYVIEALNDLTGYVGPPKTLVSDRGTAYTSKEFRQYCIANNIKHRLNAVRTPRANGQVERYNKTILSMLTTMTDNDKLWDEKLRDIQWSLNTMKCSSTGFTPQQLLYGFTPRDALQNHLLLTLHEDDIISEEQLNERRQQAVQRIKTKRSQAKQRFDKRHGKPKSYDVGDLVLTESDAPSLGHSRKLEAKYKGPFLITRVLGNDRYVVEDLPKSRRSRVHYSSVFSSDKLKKWCQMPEDDIADESDAVDEDAH